MPTASPRYCTCGRHVVPARQPCPCAKARAEAKQKEESEKLSRRLAREAAYRRKHPPGFAQCGINWYPAGSGWTHCHKCGQPLIYTTDPNALRRECPGRRP